MTFTNFRKFVLLPLIFLFVLSGPVAAPLPENPEFLFFELKPSGHVTDRVNLKRKLSLNIPYSLISVSHRDKENRRQIFQKADKHCNKSDRIAKYDKHRTEKEPEKPGQSENVDLSDPDNPINPKTGIRYTNSQMDRFDRLRKKFPNNSIIPRRKSAKEILLDTNRKKRIKEIRLKIAKGQANRKEINLYYDYRKKSIKDRIELMEFVFSKHKEIMDSKTKKQYKKVLKMNYRTLKELEKSRKKDLKTLRNNT